MDFMKAFEEVPHLAAPSGKTRIVWHMQQDSGLDQSIISRTAPASALLSTDRGLSGAK